MAKKMCCLHPGGQELTRKMLGLAALPEGSRIADVGSGMGVSLALLKGEFGLDAVGVEPDDEKRALSLEPQLDGTAEHLPIPDGSLDALLSECVLSLVSEPDGALSEVRRVLKPEGLLLISDLYTRGRGGEDRGILSQEELYERLKRAGFQVMCFEDCTAELLTMAGQAILSGVEICSLANRSFEELRRLKCGYYYMIARKEAT